MRVQELGPGRGDESRSPQDKHIQSHRVGTSSWRMDSSSLVGKETGNQMHLPAEMGLHSFFLSFPSLSGQIATTSQPPGSMVLGTLGSLASRAMTPLCLEPREPGGLEL